MAALEAGRGAEAEAFATPYFRGDGGDIEAALVVGLALALQGDSRRAAPLLQHVAHARPGFAHPCADLARLSPGNPALVATQFAHCAALDWADVNLAYCQAEFLLDCGQARAAAAVMRRGLAGRPEFAPGWNMLGMALLEGGDAAGAIEVFERAVDLNPDEGGAWTNLGMALKIEGRFDAAVVAHDRAIACAPSDPRLRLNRAVTLLRAGRMAEAWPDYEARLESGRGPGLPMNLLLPDVATLDLAGRTVLAWHEEGFGDTLQFGRYLPMLVARGARVLLRVPEALTRLMAQLPGVEILPEGAAIPPFDWHVPVFSLPRAFATTLDTVPAVIPYLRADPLLTPSWNARLPEDGLRVGVVWAGQARPWLPWFTSLDRRRSASLADLAPLGAVPGVALVSLQKGAPAAEPRPDTLVLHDFTAEIADFADTAAIIANLDVVVSVDTSVAHLAGAMGKPVLLLDRYDSCWRWLAGRDDSPWYPSLRILRQTISGEWAPVVAMAADALRTMAEHRRRAPPAA